MRKIISLASALRVPVVSTMLGAINDEDDPALAGRTREAIEVLAGDADRQGVTVAIETVGVSTQTLGEWLQAIGCRHLNACCDSGALIMQGENPHRLGDTLAGRVGLVRARDAIAAATDAAGHEVAMGDGALDIPRFLSCLIEAGFEGHIVLSRTTGTNPAVDLLDAKNRFGAVLFD